MTKREAKRRVCRAAGWALMSILDMGWPTDHGGVIHNEMEDDDPDADKLIAAMKELQDELFRRAGGPGEVLVDT